MLTIENLHACYGPSRVLHGVSFALEPGTIGAVLGRNGVGKTTTAKTIMGFVTVTGGSIRLGEESITHLSPYQVARLGVGYVPEGRMVFPDLTVLENIVVAQRQVPVRWTLRALFKLFPRLEERSTQKGSSLSGGEQQMLVIARALASEPKLLVFDEPSQGLAPLVVRELVDVFKLLRDEGITILLIEQNLKLAEKVADQMFVMSKGQIAYQADPARFRDEIDSIRTKYLTV
ncbi:ABC transporter ATP-binding protein [Parapusillimonas sp. SGNA-6]|nr:ABC transporter ATP-binding protein [Parapusillimonas sp. SGNA-6]